MSKKAVVILAEGFEGIEAVTPIDILRRAGIDVTVAGLGSNTVKGARGIVITADKQLDGKDTGYDACILPGGLPGATNLASSDIVNDIIKTMASDGKTVAAICASPTVVLSPAGVLSGRAATCYPGIEDGFAPDVTRKTDPVVADGNIITSRGPATALLFSLAIVEDLCGKDTADKIRKATLAG